MKAGKSKTQNQMHISKKLAKSKYDPLCSFVALVSAFWACCWKPQQMHSLPRFEASIPQRPSETKVIHLVLEYNPVVAWVLFQEGRKFGKTHPTCLFCMQSRIKRYIICPDWCTLLGGVW